MKTLEHTDCEWDGHYASLVASYALLITRLQMINSARNEFCCYRKCRQSYDKTSNTLLPEFTPCVINEKNWSSLLDKVKSMIQVLYVLWLVKAHLRTKECFRMKQCWTMKKIQAHSLIHQVICLAKASVRQLHS